MTSFVGVCLWLYYFYIKLIVKLFYVALNCTSECFYFHSFGFAHFKLFDFNCRLVLLGDKSSRL